MNKELFNEPIIDDGSTSEVQKSKTSSNTVENKTPTIRKKSTWYEIKGNLIGSANAGFPRCVHFQWYTAGTPIKDIHFKQTVKRLTPLRPNLSRLSMRMTTIFVPLNAVWKKAYLWESQQSDNFHEPTTEMPKASVDLGIFNGISNVTGSTPVNKTKITNNSLLDIILNSQKASTNSTSWQAQINLTLLRAIKKSYNYIFRPKQDIAPYIEFEDDGSVPEFNTLTLNSAENFYRRSTQRKAFTNSWRYQLQVGGTGLDAGENQAEHTNWQMLRAELLRQAVNQEKSDIEIIKEFYGTTTPKENRPFVIGQKTVDLDDTIIAQSSTTNEAHLGLDGAVTTFVSNEQLVDNFYSNVSGWILTFYEFQTEPTILGTRNRESFLVNYKDFYRKDLLAIKDEQLYQVEVTGSQLNAATLNQPVGYIRKFSELKRLPDTFIGDCFDTKSTDPTPVNITSELKKWHTHPEEQLNNTPIDKIDRSYEAILRNSLTTTDSINSGPDQFWFVGTKYCRIGYDEETARELEINPWGEE